MPAAFRVRGVWVFLALVLSVLADRPASAEGSDGCPAGYRKVGEVQEETADAIIIHPKCRRIVVPGAVEAARYCKKRDLVQRDISAIKQLDFRADVASYENFQKLSKKEKEAFEKKVLMATIDQGLEAAEKGVDAARSLNPWNVNTAISQLKAKGYVNETLFKAMRAVASARNKPAKAAAYKFFVSQVKAGYEGYSTGQDMREDPGNAKLTFLLGALKVVQTNPGFGLVVTGAEFTESLAWLYYLNKLQNQQLAITDEKLRLLGLSGANLKTHMGAKNAARLDWQKATGKSGEPACGD